MKPPTDEAQDCFFFPQAMITGGILEKDRLAGSCHVFVFVDAENGANSAESIQIRASCIGGYGTRHRSKGIWDFTKDHPRHIEQLNMAGLLDKFSGPIL